MSTSILAPYRSFAKNLCRREKEKNNGDCLSEVTNHLCYYHPSLSWVIKTWLKSGNQIALMIFKGKAKNT